MKSALSAFTNTMKVPELRSRILFTLAMIVIVRFGTAITLPGVNPEILDIWVDQKTDPESRGGAAVAALMNVFSGGGLANCAIFALGIMPYISASIIMQLMTAVVPQLSKLSREDGGRQKINQYTRFFTILLCLVQGGLLAKSLLNPAGNIFLQGLDKVTKQYGPLVPGDSFGFLMTTIISITAGTMLLMWIGEQITERGIGNGISIIICVNIISALPGALVRVWQTYIGSGSANPLDSVQLVILVAFFLLVTAAIIALTQAQRRIGIQYAKRVVGRKVYGGQTNYLPLKVVYAGVMPIIFAQAILLFPSQFISQLFPDADWAQKAATVMTSGWAYYVISGLLIFFFSYFWVAMMFQPTQIADDLKRSGGYIPGVRPGKPTAQFLDFTMSRLTFAGALFLTIVAILPNILASLMQVDPMAAQFFGGTSLLILVGVVLDVMRQTETHLLQQHYDGFLRKGKIKGRFERTRMASSSHAASNGTIMWLWVFIAILIILGMAYSIYQKSTGG